MTVAELIEELERLPSNYDVIIDDTSSYSIVDVDDDQKEVIIVTD